MVGLTANGDAEQVEARLREALDAHGHGVGDAAAAPTRATNSSFIAPGAIPVSRPGRQPAIRPRLLFSL